MDAGGDVYFEMERMAYIQADVENRVELRNDDHVVRGRQEWAVTSVGQMGVGAAPPQVQDTFGRHLAVSCRKA